MINIEFLQEIKQATGLNDRPYKVERFAIHPDQYGAPHDFLECYEEPQYFDCHILPIMELGDMSSKMKIAYEVSRILDKKRMIDEGEEHNHSTPWQVRDAMTLYPTKWLTERDNPLLITNFEYQSNACKEMISKLLEVFYYDADAYGVWPAITAHNSGCANALFTKKGILSRQPEGEPHNNFILQTYGSSKYTIYKERYSGIVNNEMPFEWPVEKRRKFFDSLEVQEVFELNPGDLLYIPDRQFWMEESEEDRIYVNFPIILKGPQSSYQSL